LLARDLDGDLPDPFEGHGPEAGDRARLLLDDARPLHRRTASDGHAARDADTAGQRRGQDRDPRQPAPERDCWKHRFLPGGMETVAPSIVGGAGRLRKGAVMPSIFTHAVAGLGLAAVAVPDRPAWAWGLAAFLGALPDFDALGFYAGVPYRSVVGHR